MNDHKSTLLWFWISMIGLSIIWLTQLVVLSFSMKESAYSYTLQLLGAATFIAAFLKSWQHDRLEVITE